MKVLNLYAGIGGNRKLWDNVEVTAVELNENIANVYKELFPQDNLVIGDAHEYLLKHYKEFDFIWTSPPCQTHSRIRMWGWKNNEKVETKYPDMKIYQEIIFLKHYYSGYWVVENVTPYYEPLINADVKIGRHLFWSNYIIPKISYNDVDINRGSLNDYKNLLGIDLGNYKIGTRKDTIYRNCVLPEIGLHIFNSAFNKKEVYQDYLFNIASN